MAALLLTAGITAIYVISAGLLLAGLYLWLTHDTTGATMNTPTPPEHPCPQQFSGPADVASAPVSGETTTSTTGG